MLYCYMKPISTRNLLYSEMSNKKWCNLSRQYVTFVNQYQISFAPQDRQSIKHITVYCNRYCYCAWFASLTQLCMTTHICAQCFSASKRNMWNVLMIHSPSKDIHIQNHKIFDNTGNSGNASTIPAECVSAENAGMVGFRQSRQFRHSSIS